MGGVGDHRVGVNVTATSVPCRIRCSKWLIPIDSSTWEQLWWVNSILLKIFQLLPRVLNLFFQNLVCLHEVCHYSPWGFLFLRRLELSHCSSLLPHCCVHAESNNTAYNRNQDNKPCIENRRLVFKRSVGDFHQGVVAAPPPPLYAVAQRRLQQLKTNKWRCHHSCKEREVLVHRECTL